MLGIEAMKNNSATMNRSPLPKYTNAIPPPVKAMPSPQNTYPPMQFEILPVHIRPIKVPFSDARVYVPSQNHNEYSTAPHQEVVPICPAMLD